MMQYLRPAILARSRSPDEDVSEAGAAEWEQAVARYNAQLNSIRPSLPAGVCYLLDHYSLHDGRILSITLGQRRPRLSVLIQLEGRPARPGKLLELQYLLARTSRQPAFSLQAPPLPEKVPQEAGRIQYDEFTKVTDDPVDVFSHSLLLKGEAELQIWFTEMGMRHLRRVILPSVEQLGLATA